MKFLFLFLTISSLGFAADDKKPPEPISIAVVKNGAKYDQVTGKWTLEKGVEPEEIMTSLLRETVAATERLKSCEAAAAAAKSEEPKKKK